MNLRRHFTLVFAFVGLVLVFALRLISQLLVPYEKVGSVLRPAGPISPARILAANWVTPALFLCALAAGLWLELGTPVPRGMGKRWPWAIAIYCLLHVPLAVGGLPGLSPSSPLFRWSFLISVGLSFLGLAAATWTLSARPHLLLPWIVLVPVLSLYFLRRLPFSFRFAFSSLGTVIVVALIGWCLRDSLDVTT